MERNAKPLPSTTAHTHSQLGGMDRTQNLQVDMDRTKGCLCPQRSQSLLPCQHQKEAMETTQLLLAGMAATLHPPVDMLATRELL